MIPTDPQSPGRAFPSTGRCSDFLAHSSGFQLVVPSAAFGRFSVVYVELGRGCEAFPIFVFSCLKNTCWCFLLLLLTQASCHLLFLREFLTAGMCWAELQDDACSPHCLEILTLLFLFPLKASPSELLFWRMSLCWWIWSGFC